jgi:catechol 2,3-dioxygenase-like lactoylglutathione lyase family enzyme
MAVSLAHVTFDSADPPALAEFWAKALERTVDDGASEFFASIDDQDPTTPSWFFVKVPEAKAMKSRVHVDVSAIDRDKEADRLVALGATRFSDHDEWGAVWTVMSDPEGNEFCIGQSPSA